MEKKWEERNEIEVVQLVLLSVFIHTSKAWLVN